MFPIENDMPNIDIIFIIPKWICTFSCEITVLLCNSGKISAQTKLDDGT